MTATKFSEATAKALATAFKESLDPADHSHMNLMSWLSDALADCKPAGCWCYLQDFIGDSESGEVFFCCNGDLTKAPYTITQDAGKISVKIDMTACEDVLAVTTYKVEDPASEPAEPMDYMGMEAARLYTPGDVPLIERNITQKMRKSIPSDDFAGKNKSFPISKAEDVKAAVSSMGRAGSANFDAATLKANITRIAKKKGFESELPKAWTDSKTEEASRTQEAGARHSKVDQGLIQNIHDHAIALGAVSPSKNDNNVEEAAAAELTGDVIPLREGAVGQDGTVLIKVIQPGWGASGYYSEAVLERDLPKIYPTGTKMFWDHQTEAEEAARPEGSLRELASVTTEPVKYMKDGPDGAAGYVRAKAFEAFKQPIEDLSKYIGTSIRASGRAKEGKAPDGKTGPIIEQLTYGHSIDYVTTPGAGGKVLQLFEAARGRIREAQTTTQQQEPSMAENDQKLTEAVARLEAENRKFKERLAITDASGAVAEYFRSVRVPSQAIVERVTARVLAGNIPLTEAGDLDRAKVKTFAEAQLNEELEFLKRINPSLVTGMGPAPTQMSEAQRTEARKEQEQKVAESNKRFASMMGFYESKVAERIFREGRAAFDVNYNARTHGARADRDLSTMGVEN